MLSAAITGGIGSGKTIVARIFEILGVPVYYADSEARKFYSNKACLLQVKKEFGTAIFSGSQIDLKALAGLVFRDRDALAKLNAIIHPMVLEDFHKWQDAHSAEPMMMMESAIIFESGLTGLFDEIITVYAPEEVCIRRIAERDGMAETDIRRRMSMQEDPEVKAKKAGFVIYNDDTQAVIPQVLEVYRRLKEKS